MGAPFLAEIRIVGCTWVPDGWAECDGALLPLSQHTGLYSLIGTTFGGDGGRTFALPNLAGRVVVGAGQGPGLSSYEVGQSGGATAVALKEPELPEHTHSVQAVPDVADQTTPGTDRALARSKPASVYTQADAAELVSMAGESLPAAGASQAHNNMSPALVLKYVIAMHGVFPERPS